MIKHGNRYTSADKPDPLAGRWCCPVCGHWNALDDPRCTTRGGCKGVHQADTVVEMPANFGSTDQTGKAVACVEAFGTLAAGMVSAQGGRPPRAGKGAPGVFSVFIPCDPPRATAQGSSRILRRRDGTQFIGRFATSKATKAKTMLLQLLTPVKPSKPFEGVLRVSLLIEWPWLKSDSKATRNRVWIPVGTRPDCDNLSKMLCDALTDAGYWRDDGQIAHLTIIKQRGTEPGITIEIEEWGKIT